MLSYVWSCLACGQANPPAAQTCVACACPARVDVKQLARFRAWHCQVGGEVRAGAALEPDSSSAWKALLWPLWLPAVLLFGYLPRLDRRKRG